MFFNLIYYSYIVEWLKEIIVRSGILLGSFLNVNLSFLTSQYKQL